MVIGDDLLGGSFVFDPFELYAAGVVSNPNMTGFLQDRSDDPADQLEDPAYGAPRRCRARGMSAKGDRVRSTERRWPVTESSIE